MVAEFSWYPRSPTLCLSNSIQVETHPDMFTSSSSSSSSSTSSSSAPSASSSTYSRKRQESYTEPETLSDLPEIPEMASASPPSSSTATPSSSTSSSSSSSSSTGGHNAYIGFAAGICSGWTKLVVGHPFDTIKTRLQCAPPGTFGGAWEVFMSTIKKEGPRALYKGASVPAVSWGITDSILMGR